MTRSAKLILIALLPIAVACHKVEDKTPPEEVVSGPDPTGTPNSVVSWGGGTSRANIACLQGSTLTIKCKPLRHRSLTITIPNYSGPGSYTMGTEASAVYWDDISVQAPAYYNTSSATGEVVIDSYYSTIGLTGTFSFTLYRFGDPLSFTNGVLDQVRPSCSWPDDLLSYTMAPFTPTHVVNAVTTGERWTYSATSTAVRFDHTNTWGVSNPSTMMNELSMFIPRNITEGTHANPAALANFTLNYIRPTQSHTDTSDPTSWLNIELHDTELRHMKGTFSVKLTNGPTATGAFNVYY